MLLLIFWGLTFHVNYYQLSQTLVWTISFRCSVTISTILSYAEDNLGFWSFCPKYMKECKSWPLCKQQRKKKTKKHQLTHLICLMRVVPPSCQYIQRNHIYPKYWDTLSTYHTCHEDWNSPFYYLLMCLKCCCMYGKQCRPWSDAAFCGV